ncbi:hypothetical protein RDI58_007859 [Solanum bulbocastanum]|uniref:Uncharacterized protein n=1 Tax=Solanum bulbocastanum TaxID=147425 RepID=A0AAN8U1G0_SOLBU
MIQRELGLALEINSVTPTVFFSTTSTQRKRVYACKFIHRTTQQCMNVVTEIMHVEEDPPNQAEIYKLT